MARYTSFSQRILPCLILTAMCVALVGASTSDGTRRDDNISGESSQRSQERTRRSQSFRLSTSKSNEIIGETGRKVSHRLIGGHLRVDRPKHGGEEGEGLWDDGFLISSAGNGKERKNVRNDEDDDKKTLSQQVKEGKYGLIQNEIYGERPKRPGIISYHGNSEVPRDTISNLGGLDEEEIWLAENHMLVLRGGKFPEHESEGQHSNDGGKPWPPIDDYQAPKRQVKIPSRPKVPPPFPVQLAEGGPVQIIGPNGTTDVDKDSLDYESNPFYRKGSLPGEGPFFAITANGTLLPTNLGLTRNSSKGSSEERTKFGSPPDSSIPGSIFHSLPPGAVFVPPPSNQSDYDDEDQSIYYPPPYSFQYKQDNSTEVPPGPLVPGIILPPPPDFFASLDEKKTTTKKYAKRPTETTPLPRARPTYLPPRKLTTKYQKSVTSTPSTVQKTTIVSSVHAKAADRPSCRNGTCSSRLPARNYQKSMSYAKTTTPQPQKSTTMVVDEEFNSIRPVIGNQVSQTNTEEKSQWPNVVDGKVPVLAYYPTTPSSTVERPLEVTPASIKSILTTSHGARVPNQASYYFYEESNENTAGTAANQPAFLYRTTTESPYYRVELQNPQEEKKSEYYRVEGLPEESSKGFSLINSLVKDPQVYYTDSVVTSKPLKYKVSSARAQSHRVLADPPLYYQTITDRPAVEIETYRATLKPQSYYEEPKQVGQFDYREGTKSKPIYQYSFESADYSAAGGGNPRPYRYQSPQEQRQQVVYNDYANTQSENIRYSQNTQQLRSKIPYKTQRPIASATTTTESPIVDTTQNPQQAYFTQQEERLLDDVTKEYFTIFGKKLAGKGLPSTTPLYGKASSVTERPNYEKNVRNYKPYVRNDYNNYNAPRPDSYQVPNVDVQYGDMPQPRPYSLKDDTLVNYKDPLPTINPDSEFISIVDPKQQDQPSALRNYATLQRVEAIENRPENYPAQPSRERERLTAIRGYGSQQQRVEQQPERLNGFAPINDPHVESYPIRPPTLADDIAVNYRDPRPPINPDAEFIDPASLQSNRADKTNGYFAYRLPGDGGHFYFLTPQTVSQRQDQRGAYLYPKPRASRLLRRRRGPGSV